MIHALYEAKATPLKSLPQGNTNFLLDFIQMGLFFSIECTSISFRLFYLSVITRISTCFFFSQENPLKVHTQMPFISLWQWTNGPKVVVIENWRLRPGYRSYISTFQWESNGSHYNLSF